MEVEACWRAILGGGTFRTSWRWRYDCACGFFFGRVILQDLEVGVRGGVHVRGLRELEVEVCCIAWIWFCREFFFARLGGGGLRRDPFACFVRVGGRYLWDLEVEVRGRVYSCGLRELEVFF
jgi:hypothetical protein